MEKGRPREFKKTALKSLSSSVKLGVGCKQTAKTAPKTGLSSLLSCCSWGRGQSMRLSQVPGSSKISLHPEKGPWSPYSEAHSRLCKVQKRRKKASTSGLSESSRWFSGFTSELAHRALHTFRVGNGRKKPSMCYVTGSTLRPAHISVTSTTPLGLKKEAHTTTPMFPLRT